MRRMKIRGVIFDMDGTITEPYIEFDKIREEVDVGNHDLIDYMKTAPAHEVERLQLVLTRYEEAGVANATLNRGARELLDFLASKSIPTALLTRNSRKSLDGVCRKLALKFDISFSREEGPHKPAPEPIWEIAKRWNANPGEVLMVGDYKWDLMCARNAGSPCAILTNGQGVQEWASGADYIVHQLDELIPIIRGKQLA
jgi:HAD superfamily hydrolase (TIGR01549 family)